MAQPSAVFLQLVDFAQRSKQRAEGLPQQTEAVRYWSGVGFTLDGQHYAAPMDQVAEILTVPHYTRVPGVMTWMKGIANVRGRLLPVMDLIGFFDRRSSLQEKKRRLLVVDHDDVYSGLVVDEVLGMQHFAIDTFAETHAEKNELIQPYVNGKYDRDGQQWRVFDLHRLAADPRFMQVARTG